MKKKLLIVAAVLLILVIAGVVIVISSIDGIARSAIQKSGTYALGTRTTVSSVHVGLLSGKFSMSGLNVANPSGDGFRSDHFLTLGSGAMAVTLSTLRQPTVDLPRLALDKLDISLEKHGGKTNYGVILDNLARLQSADKKPAAPSTDEKRFIIHDLDIENIVVRVDLAGLPGPLGAVNDLTRVTIPIDRIKIAEIGQTGSGKQVSGKGVTISELSAIVVKSVLDAATEKGSGLIPAELLNDLKGKLSGLTTALGDLGKVPIEVIAGSAGQVEEIGEKAVEGVVDQGKKALDDAANKLKGLIPGDKKKDDKK